MFTLRCTARLLKRMGAKPVDIVARSEGRLGDWYATIIFAPRQAIVCMSERTLLPVVLPALDAKTFPQRLGPAVQWQLRRLGVAEDAIRAEAESMSQVTIAATADRRALGSLMEFARLLAFALDDGMTVEEAMADLAETPCRSMSRDAVFPDRATVEAFG